MASSWTRALVGIIAFVVVLVIGINTIVRVSNCEVIDSSRRVWAYSVAA
jgi:hypothetical protein